MNVFEEPPDRVPPVVNTPSKRVVAGEDTEVTLYISEWLLWVNSGALTSMVAPLTVFGQRYEHIMSPLLSIIAKYLPLDTETEESFP